MASRYELELTVSSAKDLKNVNWRHGELRPYAVVWVDPSAKCSTKVDVDNDDDPIWDEKLTIALPGYDRRSAIDDAVLHIDVVHANAEEDVKPLIGSARLPLREVVDEAGIGGKVLRTLKLKRPSGRPHGKIELKLCVREPARYYAPSAAAPPYGTPYGHAETTRDFNNPYGYSQPPPTGYSYGAPPPSGYPYGAPPPSGYPYGGPPPPMPAYGGQGSSYAAVPPPAAEKKSKFGMGTGLAVGAAAGVLGGLALVGGAEYLENKIEDHVAEKVEDDLGYDNDDYGGDDYGGDDY